jgi:hypothetical protein
MVLAWLAILRRVQLERLILFGIGGTPNDLAAARQNQIYEATSRPGY